MTVMDQKEPRRITDRGTIARFHRLELRCLYCNDRPTDPHHIYPKGRGGDDVMANLVPLCRRDHDALHGASYMRVVNPTGERVRVEASDVRFRIGRWLQDDDGRDARAYLVGKLGTSAAERFMLQEYGVRT